MRIRRFTIKNFKGIGEDEVKVDFSENIVVLIGENNVGKSAILEALDYFFSGTKTIPSQYFHNLKNDKENAIVVTVEFDDLTDKDKAHQAISPYISTDVGSEYWKLRKTYYTESGKGRCDYIAIVNDIESGSPGGFTQNCDDLFTDEKMQKVFVPAVQHISDVVDGKKKSPFSQIFQLLLSEELQGTAEYKVLLIALENYSKLFEEGTKHTRVTEIEGLITEKVKRVIEAAGLIGVELPSQEKLLPTPVLATNDGRDVSVEPAKQGHGLQRALVFALLELYAETVSKPGKEVGVANLFLIEEPEIFMHPQMERKIADVLYTLAESGYVQVICTTHSPIFIRLLEKQKSLVRLVRNSSNKVEAIQVAGDVFSGNPEEKKKRLRMVMDFTPAVNELFFAKRIVLLEGYTEYIIFPKAAELLDVFSGTNISKNDTTLVNCMSRDHISLFQEVINHFQIPYFVVHDLESDAFDQGRNAEILNLIGGDETRRKYFDPHVESVLSVPSGNPKWMKAYEKIEELDANGTLDAKFGDYVRFVYGV